MNPYQRGQIALCGDYFKYTPSGASAFKHAGRWYKEPLPGSVVFFYSPSMGRICHVGIVESVEGNRITTIEGNTSGTQGDRNGGECRRKTYNGFSVGGRNWINGFGRPVYGDDTCTAQELLDVARGEIGYEEKASPNGLEDKHANRGKNNYTKYGQWYNNGKALSEFWCAEFVSWCFYMACKNHATTQQEPRREGWQQLNDKWMFYVDNVPLWGGWRYINGRWYAFDNAGFMIKGWFKTEEGWYYLGEDGGMLAEQWVEDKGKWYYLTKTGLMATNAKVKKTRGEGFDYVGEDGAFDSFKSLLQRFPERTEIVE